jgi:hypothetical protein
MTRSSKKAKGQTAAQLREATIAEMMGKAAAKRAKNQNLIQQVRKDKALADKVRDLLCEDLRRVFAIPRDILGPSASRRRYRELGHFSEELVTYLIGAWEEFKRQAKIEPSLGVKTVERNISKTLRAQQVMEYADQHVKPWDGAYDNLDMTQERVTLAIGSDFHSKYLDPFARRVWMEVLATEKPNGVRFNGDGPDFPQLSRHRQLPGHFALSVQDEIDIWAKFMADSRTAVGKKADLKWVLGNHDIRLVTALADSFPIFASLRSNRFHELFDLDKQRIGLIARSTFLNPSGTARKNDIAQNWETLTDAKGRPFWTTVHGFLCGKDAPNAHLRKFMTYGTNGHLHDERVVSGGSLATGILRWFQTGCMAWPRALSAGYIHGPIEATGWGMQFILVTLFPRTRHVQVEPVRIGEDMATFRNKVWHVSAEELSLREQMMEV